MSEPMSQEAAEQPRTYAEVEPIPVAIVEDRSPEKVQSATYGGWSNYLFAGNESIPVQVLRMDTRRRRAVLQCMPGAAANTIGNLWIGSKAQIGNGNPALSGAMLVNGSSFTVESGTDIWCLPDGVHSLTLVVLDEIYRS